jgi:hypothetical protein
MPSEFYVRSREIAEMGWIRNSRDGCVRERYREFGLHVQRVVSIVVDWNEEGVVILSFSLPFLDF